METTPSAPTTAFISCRQWPVVDWQLTTGCPFTDELAVFRLAVPTLAGVANRLESLLTPAEQDRANRYHRPADRLRFVGGRGLLRILAGQYSHQPPDRVQLDSRAGHKPALLNAPGVQVSVSHGGNWVLMAVGRGEPVGIDVERVDESVDYQAVAQTSFGPADRQCMIAAGDPRRVFYECWTRKEALVKATGTGITDDFCHIPTRTGNHVVDSRVSGVAGAWVVAGFAVDAAHPAAVAFRPGSTGPVFYTIHADLLR